jgi:hypothetical protein
LSLTRAEPPWPDGKTTDGVAWIVKVPPAAYVRGIVDITRPIARTSIGRDRYNRRLFNRILHL